MCSFPQPIKHLQKSFVMSFWSDKPQPLVDLKAKIEYFHVRHSEVLISNILTVLKN